jgi:hypothetical protein
MGYNNHIIYYDFNNLNFSSFFLTGFHHNTETFPYKFIVSKTTPPLLFDQTMDDRWKEILFSICLFNVKLPNEQFYFCIDTRDSCEACPKRGNGYHLPLLKQVKYYFKVNYNLDAINNDPNLAEFSNKIVPTFPFFPIKCPNLLRYFPRFIPCSTMAWTMRDAVIRIKTFNNMLSLEQLRQMRNSEKDLDVFFVVTFYDDKEHSADNELRYQLMKEIQKYPNISSFVGFVSYKKIPGKYADLQIKPYSLKKYLSCLAKSRIAIYVRGLNNCLSFKFGQLLLLGMPIVGQTIHNNKDNIMTNDYFNEQFAYDDPKAIVRRIIELLENPSKQITLGQSNAKVFDTKFTPKAVVSDILRHMNIKEQ